MSTELLDVPPAATAGARTPFARTAPRPTGRRANVARARWPLWLSLALHAAAGGVALVLHVAPPAPAPARPPDVRVVMPEAHEEAPAEPEAPVELPEMLELPPPVPSPAEPLPTELALEESPEAPVELAPSALETVRPDELPHLADVHPVARRTPPPAPVVRAAPVAAPVPAPAAPIASAAPGPRRVAPAATRAPDLPMDPRLSRLPRGLVVGLVLTVEADGRVTDVQVESSSGVATFDEAARAWVLARWRFEASPQRFRTRVPFRLSR